MGKVNAVDIPAIKEEIKLVRAALKKKKLTPSERMALDWVYYSLNWVINDNVALNPTKCALLFNKE